jgi:hypothetical protein
MHSIAIGENEHENGIGIGIELLILMRFDFIYRYKVHVTLGRDNAQKERWEGRCVGRECWEEKFVMKSASPGS